MSKLCVNGHQMEDSWQACPFCQRTGYQPGTPVTVRTRLDPEMQRESAATAAARRSVLIADKRKQPVVGWFVALTGEQKGEDFRIREGQNTIGSAPDADIVLHDTAISGKHASLRYKDEKFTITDLDSTNGTFLNDRTDPIAREELKDSDVVRMGDVILKFRRL